MKAFLAVFQNGHFIDRETKQKLNFVPNTEYTITAKDGGFSEAETKPKMPPAMASEAKKAWAEKKYGPKNILKFLDCGTKLFFRVGLSRTSGKKERQFIFRCVLLEDLYLYRLSGKSGVEAEDWRLVDCQCQLVDCISGNLELFEQIKATSLNSLFNDVVQCYFPLSRSASANLFNEFFLYQEGIKPTHHDIIRMKYDNLSKLRKEAISK